MVEAISQLPSSRSKFFNMFFFKNDACEQVDIHVAVDHLKNLIFAIALLWPGRMQVNDCEEL